MIVPSVQVQSRVPGFEEKSLVVLALKPMTLTFSKLACNFGVFIKTCHCLFVLCNLGLYDLSVWP